MSCKNCEHGPYDPMSNICDGCQNDADTGWGGFTDHKLGKHFYSEEERQAYIKEHEDFDDDDEDFDDDNSGGYF